MREKGCIGRCSASEVQGFGIDGAGVSYDEDWAIGNQTDLCKKVKEDKCL